MTIDSDKILHDLLNSLDSLEGIRPGEIPNIALYMDQSRPLWTHSSLLRAASSPIRF